MNFRKRVTVDSTYLLPLVGVAVKGLPPNPISLLIERGFEVNINEISLFEVSGKSFREAERSSDKEKFLKRIETGLKSILLDERVGKFPIFEVETLNDVIKFFKAGLTDLPDCFISTTAAAHTGLLLTESGDIKRAAERAHVKLDVISWSKLGI